MADLEERRISDLTRALDVNSSALLEVSAPDESAESGYSSKSATVNDVSQTVLGGINYETQLETPTKTIFGAINDLKKIIEGITVEYRKETHEGDFTFSSGVIGSILQGLKGKSEKSKNLLDSTYFDGLKDSAVTKFTVESKNLLNPTLATVQTINGLTFTPVIEDGLLKYINVNGTANNNTWYNLATADFGNDDVNGNVDTDHSGNGYIFSRRIGYTASTKAVFLRFHSGNSYANEKIYPMIRLDSVTNGNYVPYYETDYPITFNGKSAGSVRDELDLVSKKSVQRVGSVDLGSLDWLYNSTYQRFTNTISGAKGATSGNVPNALIPIYSIVDSTSVLTIGDMVFSITSNGTVVIRDSRYTTSNDFKSAMKGVILNYELAEPITEEIEQSEVMVVVNAGDRVTFDSDVPVGSDWSDLVFLKGV